MLKVVEQIIEVIIHNAMLMTCSLDLHLGIVQLIRQIQEKYIGKNHNLYIWWSRKSLQQGAQKGPMVWFKESRYTRVDCACDSDNISKC